MSYLLSLYNEHIRYVNSRPIKKGTIVNKIYSDISELESSMSCKTCAHLLESDISICTLYLSLECDRPFKYCSSFKPKDNT